VTCEFHDEQNATRHNNKNGSTNLLLLTFFDGGKKDGCEKETSGKKSASEWIPQFQTTRQDTDSHYIPPRR
jgi:hypothetical protein